MSGIAPSDPARPRRRRRGSARAAWRAALAACLVASAAAPALGAELRPVASLPEAHRHLLSDAAARAVDHVRAARRLVAERKSYDARKELAQASTLLAQARAASPATRVAQEITALRIRLQDPTVEVPAAAFDALFAAIDDAGDREGFAATRRYVERARYFRRDGVAADAELVSAMARIPHGEIDGPLAGAAAQVQMAAIELYAGQLETADRVLERAERSALAAVRIAAGGEADWMADVAAPPPPEAAPAASEPDAGAASPAVTESRIPEPSEFREQGGAGPGASEATVP
jgi:hypothetical protein